MFVTKILTGGSLCITPFLCFPVTHLPPGPTSLCFCLRVCLVGALTPHFHHGKTELALLRASFPFGGISLFLQSQGCELFGFVLEPSFLPAQPPTQCGPFSAKPGLTSVVSAPGAHSGTYASLWWNSLPTVWPRGQLAPSTGRLVHRCRVTCSARHVLSPSPARCTC